MNATGWIALGGVLLALFTLVIQQWQLIRANRRKETRTTSKLAVLNLCQSKSLTVKEIVEECKGDLQLKGVDEAEIRKTIYEMLAEKTLLYIAIRNSYEVPIHSSALSTKVALPAAPNHGPRKAQ